MNYIYILKDPISNEIRYVGKSNNPYNRLKKHMSDYSLIESWTSKNKWLLNLKKNNLMPLMEIIDSTNFKNIDELEIRWIKYYRDLGLKLTNGTDGGDGFDWTGRKHRSVTVEKMKLSHPKRREIIQFDLDNNIINFYRSLREIERKIFISRRHVTKCCDNLESYITVGGFYFRYIDNYFPCIKSTTNPDIKNINSKIDEFNLSKIIYLTKKQEISIRAKKGAEKRRKSIIQYDLDGNILGEYKSMSEARDITNCHIGLISKCCNQKSYYTVNKTTFRYKNDIFDYIPYNVNIQSTSRKVCKYNLDGNLIEIFDSIKQAARDINSSDANIIKCCNQKVKKSNDQFLKVKGFTYRYFEETNGFNI